MMQFQSIPTAIPVLGEAKHISPLGKKQTSAASYNFTRDSQRVVIDVDSQNLMECLTNNEEPAAFELAGPREKIFFDPAKLKCAIVTCGGLCPGLNDIIRAIVLELFYSYGVTGIYGVRYGLQGLIPSYGHDLVPLSPESVLHILDLGGSILGSSRGPQDINQVVDTLKANDIGILFMIGGDGTLVASTKIADSIISRGLEISVVGIPKTIDNDIYLVSRSFGFDTAVDVASLAIKSAHYEAEGYPNGIGLIKLMGRHSGFIAVTAALARSDANFVLIPEVEFDLEGPKGLLVQLEKRLLKRKHAVVVVAEGAGQKFFANPEQGCDESGNANLHDIGIYLREKIITYFRGIKTDIALKYIDPSYTIRSVPANASDRVFCCFLGRDAVHAGMAGKTRLLIGHWNNHFLHIPMEASVGKRKQVDPKEKLWRTVLEMTGQGSLQN